MALKSSGARAQKRNKTKSLFKFKSRGHTGVIMLYYRLAEHINKYMSVVQYIVSTLSTKVGIQLLTMSVATMRRAHTATVSNENEFVRST